MQIFRIQLNVPILLSFCIRATSFWCQTMIFFSRITACPLVRVRTVWEMDCLVLVCRREAGSVLKTIWYPWKDSYVRSIFDNRFHNDMWSCFEASWTRAWGCSEKNVLNFWTSGCWCSNGGRVYRAVWNLVTIFLQPFVMGTSLGLFNPRP